MANSRPESVTTSPETSETQTGASAKAKRRLPRFPRQQPGWVRITPLFLSALLFLSFIFSIFCALPLQVLALQKRWKFLALSVAFNALWVWVLGKSPSAFAVYVVYGLVPGVLLGVCLGRGFSLARSLTYTVSAMMATVVVGWLLLSAQHGVSPVEEARGHVNAFLTVFKESVPPETQENLMNGMEPQEWVRAFLLELPSALVIFALGQVWLSMVLLVRSNPGGLLGSRGLKAETVRNWRLPDFWVWPTIVCGALMVFDLPQLAVLTPWATNGFRILMGLYALQGLAILGAFMDAWKIRGLLRSVIYVVVILFTMPLLLSIGFFDQWFDFRKNLRQST